MKTTLVHGVDVDELRRAIAADIIDQMKTLLASQKASRIAEFASRREMAQLMRVSEATIDRWVSAGAPSILVGKNRLFVVNEIVEWARQQTPKNN